MSHSSNSSEGHALTPATEEAIQKIAEAGKEGAHDVHAAAKDTAEKIHSAVNTHGHHEEGQVDHPPEHGDHEKHVAHEVHETHGEKDAHGPTSMEKKTAVTEILEKHTPSKAEKKKMPPEAIAAIGRRIGSPWETAKRWFSTKNKSTLGKVGTWGLRLGTATSLLSSAGAMNAMRSAGHGILNFFYTNNLGIAAREAASALWNVVTNVGTSAWNFVTQGLSTPTFISSTIASTKAFAVNIGLTSFFGKLGAFLGVAGSSLLSLLTAVGPVLWVVFGALLATKAVSFGVKTYAKVQKEKEKTSPTP